MRMLPELVLDVSERSLIVIAGDFFAWSTEWTVLEDFSSLDIVQYRKYLYLPQRDDRLSGRYLRKQCVDVNYHIATIKVYDLA